MATPAIDSRPLTAADMLAMPRDGQKYELVAGELIVSPAGIQHEGIASRLVVRIGVYLMGNRLGEVYTSSVGYELPSGDVLSPDVSFVSTAKLPQGNEPQGFGKFAPDLAVEIVSPNDSMTAIEDKVEIYLKNGTQLVWVINPKLHKATVHRADGTLAAVRGDDALDGEGVLPGFTCRLTDIMQGAGK
jgi:Uma2 family endonuclease